MNKKSLPISPVQAINTDYRFLKILKIIFFLAAFCGHLSAQAQFNFTLDTILGINQAVSTEKCPTCAGSISVHIAPPSSNPLKLDDPTPQQQATNSKIFSPLAQANSSVGLLIMRGTQIHFEAYAPNVNGKTRFNSFSRAKSVISLAVGKAFCDGKISSLDTLAQSLVPELQNTVYGRAKLTSLLSMASGAAAGLPHGDTAPGEASKWLQGSKTQLETLKEYKDEAFSLFSKTSEGTFKYKNQDTAALTLVLHAISNGKTSTWFDQGLWQFVRAESEARWALDKAGVPIGSSFFGSTAQDWARLGFYINQTLRGENQENCFRDYLKTATTTQIKTDNRYFNGYGYQIWTKNYRDSSGEILWFLGVGGQMVALHPPSDSVLVYTSTNDSTTDQVANAFIRWVKP